MSPHSEPDRDNSALTLNLVRRARKGDDEALRDLAQLYESDRHVEAIIHGFLAGSPLRRVLSTADGKQDVWIRVMEQLHDLETDGNPHAFYNWINRIARNLMIDRHRAGVRRGNQPLESHVFAQEIDSVTGVDERALRKVEIGRLSQEITVRERTAILHGLDAQELGKHEWSTALWHLIDRELSRLVKSGKLKPWYRSAFRARHRRGESWKSIAETFETSIDYAAKCVAKTRDALRAELLRGSAGESE